MIKLTSSKREIRLVLNSRLGYINGEIFYLKNPPLYLRGKILIPKELEKILSRKITLLKPLFKIEKIIIDPGHGGKDPGAISFSGVKEKEINLKVSKYLKEELEKRGYKIILTRSKDTYLSLKERVMMTKRLKPDIFLSIHANSNRYRKIRGVEIYYLSPSRFKSLERAKLLAIAKAFGNIPFEAKVILWDLTFVKNYTTSIELARHLYFAFKNLGFKVSPPKKSAFYVLKFAYTPSVLVEIGYLSNRYEEKFLRKKYYQKQIAEAIALGIDSLDKYYRGLIKSVKK
jgi:N-acetylmuramoyl-L-alanine amidase